MNQIVAWIAQNWFGFFGFVIGLIFSYFLYRKSLRHRLPSYSIKTQQIIRAAHERIPGLKISFDGHANPIHDLSVTRVVFWNHGNEPITKGDVKAPIVVRFERGHVLSPSIVQFTRQENQLALEVAVDKRSAVIDFDFLDQKDGGVFQFFHDCSNKENISVSGYVVSAGTPVRREIADNNVVVLNLQPSLLNIAIAILISVIVIGGIFSGVIYLMYVGNNLFGLWGQFLGGLIGVGALASAVYWATRLVPKLPSSLSQFQDMEF